MPQTRRLYEAESIGELNSAAGRYRGEMQDRSDQCVQFVVRPNLKLSAYDFLIGLRGFGSFNV